MDSFYFSVLFAFLINPVLGTSQVVAYDVPLDSIGAWVQESPSELLAINQRMVSPDSVLFEEDYFLLYYGSAYLESYSPYGEKSLASPIYDLFDKEKYEKAIALGTSQIKEHPGYTRGYYNLAIAYDYLGDTVLMNHYLDRYYGLLGVAFYSGTGTSIDSAFVIRSIDDEYLLIQELGYKRGDQALITNDDDIPFDVLTVIVDEETEETKDVYFNIYQPFKIGLQRMFQEANPDSNPEGTETGTKKKRRQKKKRG